MDLFVDNDVVKKLASLGLLDVAIEALGGQAFVLPSAKYKFRLDDPARGQKVWGAVTHPRIADFLHRATAIEDGFDQATHDLLATVDDIDDGEALLLSAAIYSGGSLLTTGDKRCLRALHSAPNCAAAKAALAGRVICVEQLLLKAIGHVGFDAALPRISAGLNELQDTALRAAFGSGPRTSKANAETALFHYVDELRRETGSLLIP